jgi:30S ribosomal protein S31
MGKGDKKTKRGKIIKGSYGKKRPRKIKVLFQEKPKEKAIKQKKETVKDEVAETQDIETISIVDKNAETDTPIATQEENISNETSVDKKKTIAKKTTSPRKKKPEDEDDVEIKAEEKEPAKKSTAKSTAKSTTAKKTTAVKAEKPKKTSTKKAEE